VLDSSLVWDFWWGGLGIAFVAVIVVLIGGKYLSITRGYVSLCSIVTNKSYFHSKEMGGPFGARESAQDA